VENEGQKITRKTYKDPQIVAGYVERHGKNPKLHKKVEKFAQILHGKRIIDIGCGPGHDAYHFAKLGYQATGLDYSPEMIKSAKKLQKSNNPPDFLVGDMREIGEMFDENSFDGAWLSASLLHISEEDVPKVLKGIKKIVVDGGKVYIGLKAGKQGARVVEGGKYGKPMIREFIFWEEDNFRRVAEENGLRVEKVAKRIGGKTGKETTTWLNFWLEVEK
jgi:ubiquinone/menaquinone biosynthesis C-methylase UbiE